MKRNGDPQNTVMLQSIRFHLQHASASLTGTGVYGSLKYEAGVHRVQRVPTTEAYGRLHTSTMSVAVLPQPQDVEVILNVNDLKIDTFRAAG